MPRRFPIGAEYHSSGLTDFRVWAPRASGVELVVGGSLEVGPAAGLGPEAQLQTMRPEPDGYWTAGCFCPPGAHYRYRIDGAGLYPDPASRFQPFGPHGPSEIVDALAYPWRDAGWPGLNLEGQVLYELHVGTFTTQGDFRAAMEDLPRIRSLGVTCIELMPIADFPGDFGWGYDGVNLFAPSRLYGRPDDLRSLIDWAHGLGLGVILDVVYNHFGVEGHYLHAFSDLYETDRYASEWGVPINFDGPGSGPVREFVITNALYWLDEFHFDGFRLDATHAIYDASGEHILSELSRSVRQAVDKHILLIAENELQPAGTLDPPPGGWGMDALWNDDFHHSCHVALSGHSPAYSSGYRGTPQELLSAAKWSYLYQGQHYRWHRKRRGTPTRGFPPRRFVHYLDNHDQVANSLWVERSHRLGSAGRLRALTAFLLLLPQTPLLFQGQEFASSTPFLFFADHAPALAAEVRRGRRELLAQFPTLAGAGVTPLLPDPADPATFERCKLEGGATRSSGPIWRLHADLLALRKSDATFSSQGREGLDGAVLGSNAFVVRFFSTAGADRLLLVNLGSDLVADPVAEPLLAPPAGAQWTVLWSSEAAEYGGEGTAWPGEEDQWFLPGQATLVLRPAGMSPPGL
jgi:maltooligosyltrehalose trehalohydrolase